MNEKVAEVKAMTDRKLSAGIAEILGSAVDITNFEEIERLKCELTGSRAVPPDGEVALFFDALLAVTRGEVLAIFASARQNAEAWYLAKTYQPSTE